jgi:hypothetical protein
LTVHRALLAVVAVASLARGCAGAGASSPSAELSGRLDDSGVTVVAALTIGPDGTRRVQTTFTPQKTGYHLYSMDLPPGGVNGLGVPTTVTVGGSLRAAGSPTANVPVRNLRIEELDVDLPVYPDGPVTITVPVRRTGNGRAEVVVTYGACSPSNCMAPVRDRIIALAPVRT